MTARTHYVYEAYDADGLLLYVGCTGRPGDRYRSHMRGDGDARGWFHPFVTHWRVSGPYAKGVALTIEKARIAEGQPIWNGHSKENLFGQRKLIAAYLEFHGVRFVPSPGYGRPPYIVPVKPKPGSSRLVLVDNIYEVRPA